jgi:ABC-2 type transport system ATP-binding protein
LAKELSMTSGAHVRMEGVRKSYGGVVALTDLDLELRPGITGLLGPNGAGKTTLIRILATLLAPSAGEVGVNGWRASSVRDRVEIRRRLGYLPQDLGLYPRFTVFEFVDYLAMLKELEDPGERHRRVRAALEAVELEDLARRRIRTLSGGMRRRVGIAQAIVADPELLLLDEPTTGLDPEQRMRFRQLIAGIGEHRTVVLSTHLVEDVAAVCTAVVVLWQGRVRFSGTPSQLRRLADGQVWTSPEDGAGAVASWRTESGAYRVLGARPSPAAEAAAPTVEDGYLLVTAQSRREAAA